MAQAGAAEAESVVYRPPVDAVVFDPWRAPKDDFAAGNRGIDYRTTPGQPVFAAADGVVTFAGNIGTTKHVVVLHADGIRTSYSFLSGISVRRGQHVAAGDQVGSAGDDLHFGARAGDAYLDPTVLLAGNQPSVHLVPDYPRPVADERGWLQKGLGLLADTPAAALAWADQQAREAARDLGAALEMLPGYQQIAIELEAYRLSQQGCTPSGAQAPTLTEPRIAIRVGGLGSTSVSGGMRAFDAKGIGYAQVLDFSYRGGTTRENSYSSADTTGDLYASGRKLEELIRRVHRDNPGVPIDLFAHSQGGILSRIAVGELGPDTNGVQNVVTLATPHDGSDAAFGAGAARLSPWTHAAVERGSSLVGAPDIDSVAVAQLRPGSPLFARIKKSDASVRVTSISSATDSAVAGSHARLLGADNRIIDVPGGLQAHFNIPGSASARREAALAVNGLGATCKSFRTYLRQRFEQEGIGVAERTVGWGVASVAVGVP
jgi:hypothetical protein